MNPHIKNRSVALDCIRCLAIVMVLLFHVATRYNPLELDPLARMFQKAGFFGVDIFFPLSGFLISRFLLQRAESGVIKTFFLRRFFRIVPLYVVAVTAYLVISLVLQSEPEALKNIWVNYLFLTGWYIFFEGRDAIPFTITWSLSVEEFSYIILGVVAWVARRHFIPFLWLCTVLAIGLRLYYLTQTDVGFQALYYFPLARLDSIAMGGITAVYVLREKRAGRTAALLALGAAGAVALCFGSLVLSQTFIYVAITLSTCAVIAFCETRMSPLQNPVFVGAARIGFYSYFIYLFHFFNIDGIFLLQSKLTPHLYLPFWGTSLLALVISLIQAILSFRFFEGPLQDFGRGLEGPRRTKVPQC